MNRCIWIFHLLCTYWCKLDWKRTKECINPHHFHNAMNIDYIIIGNPQCNIQLQWCKWIECKDWRWQRVRACVLRPIDRLPVCGSTSCFQQWPRPAVESCLLGENHLQTRETRPNCVRRIAHCLPIPYLTNLNENVNVINQTLIISIS